MTNLTARAPAKLNLCLCVLARRKDGYHELSSLVAFADAGDELSLAPGAVLDLTVQGPLAALAGPPEQNLVVKAARALERRIEGLKLGHFTLTKTLPAGAGLGGGSADAAAALRLLASLNEIDPDDPRLFDAARESGADVPVCLASEARLMHGIGDVLGPPIALPALDAVIVFPDAPVATKDVFGNFTLAAGPRRRTRYDEAEIPGDRASLVTFLAGERNDLELAASLAEPAIRAAVNALQEAGDAEAVRMTGSGSAVFAIYPTADNARRAARKIAKRNPRWWVQTAKLG